MKLIHTSDWHLGARLYEQDRAAEQGAFLAWLQSILRAERPDALVVAGDIFDTSAPSNAAQELYYDLLGAVFQESLCRCVVITGGNHDSPSLLDSPENVLAHLNTIVVGAAPETPADEAVYVPGREPGTGLVIAAVPFLREGDLRSALPGESAASRAGRQRDGFQAHYAAAAQAARALGHARTGRDDLPLVLTGHCFITGAALSDDKSERARASIGGVDGYPARLLPLADYIALGHLHVPQSVNGRDTCRYAGSPLPMSFAEADQPKSVTCAEFGAQSGAPVTVRTLPVPIFQKLEPLSGTPETILRRLGDLVQTRASVWVEIRVTEGEGLLDTFWNDTATLAKDTPVKILARVNARAARRRAERAAEETERLDTLSPEAVFAMRLAEEDLSAAERAEYTALFNETAREAGA
jgi:exonuclease SbcD